MGKPRSALATAVAVPRWALAFYARHAGWIVGLSLIPSAQRAAAQFWGDDMPGALATGLELLTAAVRVLLAVLIVRVALVGDPAIQAVDGATAWRRVRSFARTRWASLLLQVALYGAMGIVFEVIPDQVVAPLVPEASQPLYRAVLLAVKNPTVIAFSIVWLTGTARQMLLTPAAAETGPGTRPPVSAPTPAGR